MHRDRTGVMPARQGNSTHLSSAPVIARFQTLRPGRDPSCGPLVASADVRQRPSPPGTTRNDAAGAVFSKKCKKRGKCFPRGPHLETPRRTLTKHPAPSTTTPSRDQLGGKGLPLFYKTWARDNSLRTSDHENSIYGGEKGAAAGLEKAGASSAA